MYWLKILSLKPSNNNRARGHIHKSLATFCVCQTTSVLNAVEQWICVFAGLSIKSPSYPAGIPNKWCDRFQATLSPEQPVAVEIRNTHNGVWKPFLLPVRKEVTITSMSEEAHDQLIVGFHFERKPLFYIYHVIYPVAVLLLVSLLSFFIPNRTAEKITFCVSVMVSMHTFNKLILNRGYITGFFIPMIGECKFCMILTRWGCFQIPGPTVKLNVPW
jgi:hypothetical protein